MKELWPPLLNSENSRFLLGSLSSCVLIFVIQAQKLLRLQKTVHHLFIDLCKASIFLIKETWRTLRYCMCASWSYTLWEELFWRLATEQVMLPGSVDWENPAIPQTVNVEDRDPADNVSTLPELFCGKTVSGQFVRLLCQHCNSLFQFLRAAQISLGLLLIS